MPYIFQINKFDALYPDIDKDEEKRLLNYSFWIDKNGDVNLDSEEDFQAWLNFTIFNIQKAVKIFEIEYALMCDQKYMNAVIDEKMIKYGLLSDNAIIEAEKRKQKDAIYIPNN